MFAKAHNLSSVADLSFTLRIICELQRKSPKKERFRVSTRRNIQLGSPDTSKERPSRWNSSKERKTAIKASLQQDALTLPWLTATPAIHLQLGPSLSLSDLSFAKQTPVAVITSSR